MLDKFIVVMGLLVIAFALWTGPTLSLAEVGGAVVGVFLFSAYTLYRVERLEREVHLLRSDLEHLQRTRPSVSSR